MLSPADMLIIGTAALLFFGPDQLPKVARRAGQVVRDVQATSQSFIREMERAADEPEHRSPYVPPEPYVVPDPYVPEPYKPDPGPVSLDPLITTTSHGADTPAAQQPNAQEAPRPT